MKKILFSFLVGVSLISCAQQSDDIAMADVSHDASNMVIPVDLDTLEVTYFASGCFWCVEAIFESVEGVHEAVSGYSGGDIKNPTYKQVSSGRTKHAEAVKVYYDPSVVSYVTLVDVFFNSHDPSTKNAQGPDHGPQYRSIAFYQSDAEQRIIKDAIKEIRASGTHVTTEVVKFDVFYDAEDYHQNYERLHPNQPYIRSVSIPRLNKFKQKMPEVLKSSAH